MHRLGFPRLTLEAIRTEITPDHEITKSGNAQTIHEIASARKSCAIACHSKDWLNCLKCLIYPLHSLLPFPIPFPYSLPCSPSSDSLFVAAVAVAVVSSLAVPLVYQITAWQLVHNLHPCYHYIAVMDVQSRFTLSYPCPFFKQYEITYL